MAAVLVHVELDKRRPHASSLAALATGRRLASAWGATLYAAVIVHDPTLKVAAPPTTSGGNDATNPALAITGQGARIERKRDDQTTAAERVIRAGTAKARRAPDDVPTPVRARRDTKLPAEAPTPRRRGAIVIGGSARRGGRVDEAGDTGRHDTIAPTDVHDDEPTASAVLAAADLRDLDRELGRAGADKVVIARTDAEVQPLWSAIGAAWSGVVDHLRPRLVLFGGDAPATAELGARTGARIGARLLTCARASGVAEVELRDRDGAYVRANDSGATVALIAGAATVADPAGDVDVDLVLLTVPGSAGERARVELAGKQPAPLAHAATAIVALGDDALAPAIVAGANRLAQLLGGIVVGGPAAAAAGAIPHAAVFERDVALAPDLCVAVGAVALDLAGTTTVVAIGPGAPAKTADGTLAGPAADALAELVRALEEHRA